MVQRGCVPCVGAPNSPLGCTNKDVLFPIYWLDDMQADAAVPLGIRLREFGHPVFPCESYGEPRTTNQYPDFDPYMLRFVNY